MRRVHVAVGSLADGDTRARNAGLFDGINLHVQGGLLGTSYVKCWNERQAMENRIKFIDLKKKKHWYKIQKKKKESIRWNPIL